MRKRSAATLLSIAFVAALALSALSQEPHEVEGGEPIAFVGHGAMFDADGNEINVTPQFIRETQKWYLSSLYRQATPEERAIFDRRKKFLFEGSILKGQSELLANSVLLFSLLDQVKPQNKCELAGKLKLMEQLLRTSKLSPLNQPISPRDTEEQFQPPLEVQERLKAAQESIATSDLAAPTTSLDGVDYIMQCAAAGVPIPPDWGDPLWVSNGTLSGEFIKPSQEAEVFTYVSAGRDAPEGACIALPRSVGDTIKLLGIICLGKKSSKACFWDYPGSIKKGVIVPLTRFPGGPILECQGGGVCTDCHAGENPFVIHPNTALDLPNLKADDFYKPLVSSSWPQNPGPSALLDSIAGEGRCTECHRKGVSGGRFPNVSTATKGYCVSVLGQAVAVQGTMPPDLPGDPRYANHANALLEACKKAP